jgi:hydrogenase expression/formation protein HypD
MNHDALTSLRVRIERSADAIGRRVSIMEVCGTHTVSIFRNGLHTLLPENLRLVSGPGCPVCVTAQRHIDAAIALSRMPGVTVATYGDMVRVPGREGSLERSRALGADVRVVPSTMAALRLARRLPDRVVVFIAVGFETTAPATAAAILRAAETNVENFLVLTAHKLVVPAMENLLRSGDADIDGFLCPGHVSVIIGYRPYEGVARTFHVPCVVAGFEPEGILTALALLLEQIERGEGHVENAYPTAVHAEGNRTALELMERVFEVDEAPWRALGSIPASGLSLRESYRRFDALEHFGLALGEDEDHPACRCGEVICGRTTPAECALFGTTCTPMTPFGPCMVSGEGTCSAWYKYNRSAEDRRASRAAVASR